MTADALPFTQPDQAWAHPTLHGLAGQIAAEVTAIVRHAADNAPRSLQTAIGPSQIGTPCSRKLGYTLYGQPATNNDTDPLASLIGTAFHAWLATTFTELDERLDDGRSRYLLEHRVHATPGLSGSCDLFDRKIATSIDWKVVGATGMKRYRKDGPGPQYRVQAHTYGLGLANAGETVEHVAVVFLPRAGRLDGMHVWTEPYQPQIALDAIERLTTVNVLAAQLDVEHQPDRWALIPTADDHCNYCSFHLPGSTDLGVGCPGHQP